MHAQQPAIPAPPEHRFIAVEFVAQGPFGGKGVEQAGHGDCGGAQGLRADEAVILDAERLLQQLDGGDYALVDGAIQHQQVEAGRKQVAMKGLPVVAAVEGLGFRKRQRGDVEGRITALRNAVVRQAARIRRMVG